MLCSSSTTRILLRHGHVPSSVLRCPSRRGQPAAAAPLRAASSPGSSHTREHGAPPGALSSVERARRGARRCAWRSPGPRPVPPCLVVKNGSTDARQVLRRDAGPGVSNSTTHAVPCSPGAPPRPIAACRRSCIASNALTARLSHTCRICSRSACTSRRSPPGSHSQPRCSTPSRIARSASHSSSRCVLERRPARPRGRARASSRAGR